MSDRTAGDPRGLDPRGPRFAAGITSLLLLVDVLLGLTGLSTRRGGAGFGWYAYAPLSNTTFTPEGWAIHSATLAQRALDPAFLLLVVLALLFLWGVLSPRTAPWGAVYRRLVQPRLSPPADLEDPRPPRFAQGVGLVVVMIGLVLHLGGVPWALPIAAAAAFVAAFLNAVFGLYLGCRLYLLLQRAGIVGRARPSAA
ncbi:MULTISPECIES: DUF4395 domain-containing protein [unclassified Microbacterium]|uniref:DUF4395 domain-containing protein n=1 Tax=unclassified Microbacterium TaxID=2609290 RepID=UPI00214CD4A2|nr:MULTISPECIES: DUF4395 domain-containing protein [unclassified Microbacterium]MCR2810048.1 DUF4395 domain-containing protein [Microbacterium sp. zg.B185]WIM20112.1 DUF4395 domain-containing protein [Microbacterium sp. zg-B185]